LHGKWPNKSLSTALTTGKCAIVCVSLGKKEKLSIFGLNLASMQGHEYVLRSCLLEWIV